MTVRIETANAGTYEDVDQETLLRLLTAMNEDNPFMIVMRSDLDDGYAQTHVNTGDSAAKGKFVVEYRTGPNELYQAFTNDRQVVHRVMQGYAFDAPDWRQALEWKVLDLGF